MWLKAFSIWMGSDFNLVYTWGLEESLQRGHMPKVEGGHLNKRNVRGTFAKSGNTLCISSKIALPKTNWFLSMFRIFRRI